MKAIKRQFAISFLALAFLTCVATTYVAGQTGLSTTHKPTTKHIGKKFAFLRYVGEWGGEYSQL